MVMSINMVVISNFYPITCKTQHFWMNIIVAVVFRCMTPANRHQQSYDSKI